MNPLNLMLYYCAYCGIWVHPTPWLSIESKGIYGKYFHYFCSLECMKGYAGGCKCSPCMSRKKANSRY